MQVHHKCEIFEVVMLDYQRYVTINQNLNVVVNARTAEECNQTTKLTTFLHRWWNKAKLLTCRDIKPCKLGVVVLQQRHNMPKHGETTYKL